MACLEIAGLTKAFGGLRAVDGFSCSVEEGKVTSLIGPNGAGKTTVFNVVSGFLSPTAGQVLYRDRDITGMPSNRIVELGMARTFQDLRLFHRMTVLENVMLGVQRQRGERLGHAVFALRTLRAERRAVREKALGILEQLGLTARAEELTQNLSYGEQKLLTIARAMATDAELLLLDEPAAGVARDAIDTILRVIRGLVGGGRTVLLVDHHMEAVMGVSDWVVVLDAGRKIAEGKPEAVQSNEEVVRVYLGL
ncbi:MAG: ABC transporter ATP-binding protein [Candidatus Rokuibacteriota bacterium]